MLDKNSGIACDGFTAAMVEVVDRWVSAVVDLRMV